MKKIILVFSILCMCSCVKYEPGQTAEAFKETTVQMKARHFTYDDHEYIEFRRATNGDASGVVHNPKCKCNRR